MARRKLPVVRVATAIGPPGPPGSSIGEPGPPGPPGPQGPPGGISQEELDAALALKADTAAVNAALALKADTAAMSSALTLKADITSVNAALALKADTAAMNAALALKVDEAALEAALALKADIHYEDWRPRLVRGLAMDGSLTSESGTDDTTALEDAIADCVAGDILTLPQKGTRICKITRTLRCMTIDVGMDFNGSRIAMSSVMDGRAGVWFGNPEVSSTHADFRNVDIRRIGGKNAWPQKQATITVTTGTPGTFNLVGHGFAAGQQFWVSSSSGMPGGLVRDPGPYYVLASGLTADTFQASLTEGGTAVNITTTGSGTLTLTTAIADCCLRLDNIQKSKVDIHKLDGKTSGLLLPRTSQYNTFFIGQILSCKYGVHLHSHAAGISNNQNTFIGGGIRINSNENLTQDVYGFYFNFIGSGYQFHNNNLIFNPSFELQTSGVTGSRIPFYFNCGMGNLVYGARHEANTGDVAVFNGPSQRNVIDVGWTNNIGGELRYTDNSTFGDNIVKSDQTVWGSDKQGCWQSGKISDLIHSYNATDVAIQSPFCFVKMNDDGYVVPASVPTGSGDSINPRYGYVSINTNKVGIAVHIDTSQQKSFKVFDSWEGTRPPFIVTCYDQYGVPILPAANLPIQSGTVTSEVDGLYGGSTWSATDSNLPRHFRVSAATKTVRIAFLGAAAGTAAALRGFSIYPMDASGQGFPVVVQAPPDFGTAPGQKFAATIPNLHGKFLRGERVYKADATGVSGSASEWLVTTGGRLAPAMADSTAYVANQLVSTGGNVYMTKTAGSTTTGGPVGFGITRGTDYTYGAAVFRYIGPQAVLTQINFP